MGLLSLAGAAGVLVLLQTRQLWRAAVFLGSPAAVAIMAALLAVLSLAWRDRVGAMVAGVGPVLAGAVTVFVAKPLIGRHGPTGSLLFPSGHATGATAVAVVALVLVYRRLGWPAVMAGLPVAALGVGLVGAGLVIRRYHYMSDVVGGAVLATAIIIGLTLFLSAVQRRVGGRPLQEESAS